MDKIAGADKLLIFTNVDELFSDPDDPSYGAAISLTNNLRKLAIPLIAVTSKTNAQVQPILSDFGLNAPVIVEHGSGVVIPQANEQFKNSDPIVDSDAVVEKGYQIKQFGCTYVEARAALKVIQSVVRINNLRGFGDLGVAEIEGFTGLGESEIKQIKTRNFSEIFVTPKNVDHQEIIATAAEFGFKALMGAKLSCLLGESANVATAVDWLKTSYGRSQSELLITTIGLGCHPNDLEMLNSVDLPIVVSQDQSNSEFLNQDWSRPEAKGLAGWVESVTKICASYADRS